MSKSHHKKRNVALVYEFLLRSISRALVENNERQTSAGLKIIKRHFRPGTELYKEFRLFNSLIKTTVSSDAVAVSIVNEAKLAARSSDVVKLEKEKTHMIHEINKSITDESFYDHPIDDYKIYATVGTLLSAWRNPGKYDLSKIIQYEQKLVDWLQTSKNAVSQLSENSESPGVNRLVFKIMTKKLNEKYDSVLDDVQKSLVREFALYGVTRSEDTLRNLLVNIRSNLVSAINECSGGLPDHTKDKLVTARKMVESEVLTMIDDETVSRYMSYVKLINELKSSEKNDEQA